MNGLVQEITITTDYDFKGNEKMIALRYAATLQCSFVLKVSVSPM